ncbi:MAG: cobalamin biosynthesis protein CbiX [Peptococcaceae bacterium]|nr:cobalamin biosynthesis protein CbiX [Peptococcaceae bacterium]
MKTGVIILGHGSRSEDAQVILDNLVNQIKDRGIYYYVEGAMLQFNQPDLALAISEAIGKNVEKVIVVPLFIFNGIHMKEDIPEILEQERVKYPDIEIELAGNIGADSRIAEILLDRIKEVV